MGVGNHLAERCSLGFGGGVKVLYLSRFGGSWHAVVLKTTRTDEFTQGEYVGLKEEVVG